MIKDLFAIQSFSEFKEKDKELSKSREHYLTQNKVTKVIRETIFSSWERCKKSKVDPKWLQAQLVYSNKGELIEKKEENKFLLELVTPFVEEIFKKSSDRNLLVVLCDKEGVLIDGRGHNNAWKKVEVHHFFPGANWSEDSAGTNAIGTALITGRPTQVFAAEHFCDGWQSYVCSAAPIRDPLTRDILGILDITGEKESIEAHNLNHVITQVKRIQSLLKQRMVKENIEIFQSIIDVIEYPFMIIDIKGIVKLCNPSAKNVFSLHKDENILHFFDELNSYGLEDLLIKEAELSFRNCWIAKFYPYKMNGTLLGGLVLFKRERQKKIKKFKRHSARYQFSDIITQYQPLVRLVDDAKKAAFSDKTVLITGDSGTGKEILAQSIHSHGSRRQGPFVGVNCGAVPKDLIASELFGYEKGAFTGAQSQGKKGMFLLADQGTILLDEIGDLPLSVQASLLRVLEERHIYPVGGETPIPIDVRVIAATNKDLEKEVSLGNFREDLYFRINVINFHLPPLRERIADMSLIVEKIIFNSNRKISIDPIVLDVLKRYDWPGNIRELRNVLDQALFYAKDKIGLEQLPKNIISKIGNIEKKFVADNFDQKEVLIDDKEQLLNTLEKTRWNITQTARILNISRMTVYRKMKRYGL